MGYITVPFDTQQSDVAESAFAYIEQQVPGWLPANGNLESILVEALAQLASELLVLCSLVPDAIFQYFGESVLGLTPFAPTQATSTTTWEMIDNLGYSVEAGALIAITPPASIDSYAFAVTNGFTVAAGETVAAGVLINAVEAGSAASGINGSVAVLDPLDFVAQVTLDAPTSGGVDGETIDAYLSRLSDLLTLLSPRPILPQDFAVLAQRTVPEVARAVAIDLYDNDTQQSNVPRCVTVVIVDSNGQPCSAPVKSEVDALLQAQREVNFLVFVADPAYTQIDVSFTATCYPGYLASDVQARAIANVTAYLSPQNWGVPPYGDTSARSWINDTSVRYLEVSQVINNTDGVHYVTTLQIAKHGSALGTADVVMTGVAALPTPSTITGAVTAET
jgi:hypothetical protein